MQSCWRILDVMGVLSLGVAKLMQMRVMQPCNFICNVPSRPIGVVGRYKRDIVSGVRRKSRVEDGVSIYDPSALGSLKSTGLVGPRCGDGGTGSSGYLGRGCTNRWRT